MTAVGGTSLATPAFPPVFFQTSLIHLLHEGCLRRQENEKDVFQKKKGGLEEKLGGKKIVTGRPSVGAHNLATVTAQAAQSLCHKPSSTFHRPGTNELSFPSNWTSPSINHSSVIFQ